MTAFKQHNPDVIIRLPTSANICSDMYLYLVRLIGKSAHQQ